jgi:hypothetical protein
VNILQAAGVSAAEYWTKVKEVDELASFLQLTPYDRHQLWKEQTSGEFFHEWPVDIGHFVTDPYYIGTDLNVRPKIKEFLEDFWTVDAAYELFAFIGGLGAGKSFSASLCMAYALHQLGCMRQPQKYLNRFPGISLSGDASIVLMNASAAGQKQASKVVYGEVFSKIEHSAWFEQNFQPYNSKSSELEFDHNIRLAPGTSQWQSALGWNLWGFVVDEAAFGIESDRADYVKELFSNLNKRRLSRFKHLGFGGLFTSPGSEGAYVELIAEQGSSWDSPLALDTPLPTPTGWTTMGDVAIGDLLIGTHGGSVRVVGTSPVFADRDCYAITFDDGESVVCDAGHKWETRATHAGGNPSQRGRQKAVRTTAEIAATTLTKNVSNHRIATTSPLRLPELALPIDPYVMGAWLGDGSASAARIATSDEDIDQICEALARGPYEVRPFPSDNYISLCGGLYVALREEGLLDNKHLPAAYLRASEHQRLDVLAGLMDTDGSVDENGRCEFVNTNPAILGAVMELARGLGLKPRIRSRGTAKPSLANGQLLIPREGVFVIRFQPKHHQVFRLPRKVARLAGKTARGGSMWAIRDVRPVKSVPVRCIEVDAADSLYLAGHSMVPTHNTTMVRRISTWEASGEMTPGSKIFLLERAEPIKVLDQYTELIFQGYDADGFGIAQRADGEIVRWKPLTMEERREMDQPEPAMAA